MKKLFMVLSLFVFICSSYIINANELSNKQSMFLDENEQIYGIGGFEQEKQIYQEKQTHILFINGINTDESGAKNGLAFIKRQYESYLKNINPKMGNIIFNLIYNKHTSLMEDLDEVFQQKRLERQNANNVALQILKNGIQTPSRNIRSIYETDVTGVKLILNALKSGARVILVAYSQGNLFANDLAGSFFQVFSGLKESMGVVAIADPANNILTRTTDCFQRNKHFCYATDINDTVIGALSVCLNQPVLPPNTDNSVGGYIYNKNFPKFKGNCIKDLQGVIKGAKGHMLQTDYLVSGTPTETIVRNNLGNLYRNLNFPNADIIKKATDLYNKIFQQTKK